MSEQFVRERDSAPGSSTEPAGHRSPEVTYVEIVPADLVSIVIEAIRRDHLSPDQIALVMDAAAESVLRREHRSNWTCH